MFQTVFYTIQVLILVSGAILSLSNMDIATTKLGGRLIAVGVFILSTLSSSPWGEVSFILLVLVIPFLVYDLKTKNRLIDIYVRILFSLSIIDAYLGVQYSGNSWLVNVITM